MTMDWLCYTYPGCSPDCNYMHDVVFLLVQYHTTLALGTQEFIWQLHASWFLTIGRNKNSLSSHGRSSSIHSLIAPRAVLTLMLTFMTRSAGTLMPLLCCRTSCWSAIMMYQANWTQWYGTNKCSVCPSKTPECQKVKENPVEDIGACHISESFRGFTSTGTYQNILSKMIKNLLHLTFPNHSAWWASLDFWGSI